MTKKKVLLLNDSMAGGGAEKAMSVLANELSRNGNFEIILYSLQNSFGYKLDKKIKVGYFHQAYKGLFHKLYSLLFDAFRLIVIIYKYKIKTVLSFQYRSNFTNILAKLLSSKHKCIVSERVYTNDYLSTGLRSLPYKILVKTLYSKADEITCNSYDIKVGLQYYFGIPQFKITNINNGYDSQRIIKLSTESIDYEDRSIFSNGKKTILNIGRLSRQKGQKYLIQSFFLLNSKDFQLVFIGCGEDKYYLKKLVNSFGLDESVYFLGFKSNPYRYLRKADIFAFPSLYEGFPNALVEAVILNKRIVAFAFRSGSREILDNYNIGRIVPMYEIKLFAMAINELVETAVPESNYNDKYSLTILFNKYAKLL